LASSASDACKRWIGSPAAAVAAALLVLIALRVAYPLVRMLYVVLSDAAGATGLGVGASVGRAIWNTVAVAVGSSVIALGPAHAAVE
jgi:hypothetical protein